MTTQWCTYKCNEIFAARQEDWSKENSKVRVRLECSNAERYRVINDLLLYRRPYPFNDDATGDKPNLFATEARVLTDRARYGTIGTTEEEVIDYRYKSYIDVTYTQLTGVLYCAENLNIKPPNGSLVGILYTDEEFEPQVEMITFDYRFFYWKNAQDVCPGVTDKAEPWDRGSEGAIRLDKITLKRTVEGYIRIPADALTWEGKVHSTSYTSDVTGEVFAEKTLFAQDVKFRRGAFNYAYRTPTYAIDITYVWREQGWNLFPKLDTENDPARIIFKGVCVQDKQTGPLRSFEPVEDVDMSDHLFYEGPTDPLNPSAKPDSKFEPTATNTCPIIPVP